MKFRFILVLISLVLFGCGPAPEGQAEIQPPSVPDPDGFFTGVTQFTEVTDITAINADTVRLNQRHGLMIEHHKDRIEGAKIIDFGSYDGRWAYAAIQAGAKHVTGIEINPDFEAKATQNLTELGVDPERYDFVIGDIMEELRNTEPGTYDGVICAGIYYHITYHVELMQELKRIGVKWIIMDTTVLTTDEPVIKWVEGPNGLNGLEGIPSPAAIEMIAGHAGFQYEYVPVDHLTSREMWDYRLGNRITMTIY
jgi:hypothetical protein